MVPRYLEERPVIQDDEDQNEVIPTLVVCSGELVEQVCLASGSPPLVSQLF